MLKKLRELTHVVLLCDDIEQMRTFYTQVLGLSIYKSSDDWVEISVGGTLLTLRKRNRPYDGLKGGGAGVQLAFRVHPDDVEACYRELVMKQVNIIEPPTDKSYGHRTLFFQDPEKNIVEIFADIPSQAEGTILSSLSVEQVLQISPHCELQEFKPGEIIVRQGDEADKFYIIVKGRVQVTNHTETGKELHIGWLHDGEYFGEVGLLQSHPRTATIRASSDGPVKVIAIDREGFSELIHDSEAASKDLSQAMYDRLMEMAGKIIAASNH